MGSVAVLLAATRGPIDVRRDLRRSTGLIRSALEAHCTVFRVPDLWQIYCPWTDPLTSEPCGHLRTTQ